MMNQLGQEAQGWGYVSLSPGCPQIHSWLFPGPALSSTLPPCLPSSCVKQWEALAGWSKRLGEAVYFVISFPLLQGMCLAMNGSYSHSGIPAFRPFGSSLSTWNCFLFLHFFLAARHARFASDQELNLCPLQWKHLNHWTAREVPASSVSNEASLLA